MPARRYLSPALFADAPAGAFPLTPLFDRAGENGRLFGLRLEGMWMHVGTPEAVAAAEAALARALDRYDNSPRWMSANLLDGGMDSVRGESTSTDHDSPRVFTIPASAPFLPTLIEALTAASSASRLPAIRWRLPSATIYLPTRRACRLLRDAFLDALEGDAAILPRIVAIGDIDEDEIAFAEAAAGDIAAEALACRRRSAASNGGCC